MNTVRARRDEPSSIRVAVVAARWNELIVKPLIEGALDELSSAGIGDVTLIHVPGTWEIPPVCAALLKSSKVDAVVALGCILQGETPHAKLLGADVGGALMRLQAEHAVPIAWGILTPDSQEQALDRAGLKHGNKGREAANAALDTLSVLRQIS